MYLLNNVFAIEVPHSASEIEICNYGLNDVLEYWYTSNGSALHEVTDLPPGNWQLICTTKECTEEQAKEIVGSSEWFFPVRHTRYIDYTKPYDQENKQRWSEGFGAALGSIVSLFESKGLDPNKNYVLIKKLP